MKNVISFNDFVVEKVSLSEQESLNEGIFDTLKTIYAKVSTIFSKPADLEKQVEQASVKAGTTDDKMDPKSVKAGNSIFLKLVLPTDETKKSVLALTKLSDLPDGSGLFQITGSDNADFLKSLGVTDVANLNLVGVMAIVDPIGFVKDKPLSMRVYKNVTKDGKPVVTQTLIKSILPGDVVAKEVPEK